MEKEKIEELKEILEDNISLLVCDFKNNTQKEVKSIDIEFMSDGQGNRIITSVNAKIKEGV